jgi:hypothetical protein
MTRRATHTYVACSLAKWFALTCIVVTLIEVLG